MWARLTAVLMLVGQVQEMQGNRREALLKYHQVLEVDADHAHAHAR